MERNQRRVLLVHGLDSMDLARLQLMGHELVLIHQENGGGLIRDLIDNKGTPASAELPPERVVIFNGYSDEELKEGVTGIRSTFPVRPIIAAVTDNSYDWSFEFLLTEHLIQDRDWNLKNSREYRENLIRENQAEEARRAQEQTESDDGSSMQ